MTADSRVHLRSVAASLREMGTIDPAELADLGLTRRALVSCVGLLGLVVGDDGAVIDRVLIDLEATLLVLDVMSVTRLQPQLLAMADKLDALLCGDDGVEAIEIEADPTPAEIKMGDAQ